jgi:hypothetical protein
VAALISADGVVLEYLSLYNHPVCLSKVALLFLLGSPPLLNRVAKNAPLTSYMQAWRILPLLGTLRKERPSLKPPLKVLSFHASFIHTGPLPGRR